MSIPILRPNTLAKSQMTLQAIREASRLTIRRKILLALLCASVITAGLGAYAIRNVVASSYATHEAIDGAELSIDYAATASAGDSLQSQQFARAAGAGAKLRSLLWTCAAMILGWMIAMVLARRIMGLVFSLSTLACRIAAKYFGSGQSSSGAAESEALFTTIGTMRANIVAMAALEAAGRERGRPMPAKVIAVASKSTKEHERAEVDSARSRMIGAGISF